MIRSCDTPDNALLSRYATRPDCYTDCFVADIGRPVEFGTYLCAFYGSWAFAPEKIILRLALGRPARDFDVLPLALGTYDRFAAWEVEARDTDQVLLTDISGRTRSWLMVDGRRLHFGSAVLPPTPDEDLGRMFKGLLGFHKAYSKLLLRSAVARLGSGKG